MFPEPLAAQVFHRYLCPGGRHTQIARLHRQAAKCPSARRTQYSRLHRFSGASMCPVGVSSEVRLHRNQYATLELMDVEMSGGKRPLIVMVLQDIRAAGARR